MEHHPPAPRSQLDDHPQAGQVAVGQGAQVEVDLVPTRGEFRQLRGQSADRGLVELTGQRVAGARGGARAEAGLGPGPEAGLGPGPEAGIRVIRNTPSS